MALRGGDTAVFEPGRSVADGKTTVVEAPASLLLDEKAAIEPVASPESAKNQS